MIPVDLKNIDNELIKTIKSNSKSKNYNIGAIMKNRRNEKDLTLEELCKDICCVAYQSKVERNQSDTLNEDIIPKLCERLDLNYEEILCGTSLEELELGVHEFMLSDVDALKERFNKCKENAYFSTNNLIGCMYFILINDCVSLNKYISKLDVLKSTMNTLEMSILLIVLIYYYLRTYQFIKAKKYYYYALDLECKNMDIKIILQEIKFIIECNLYSNFYNNNHEIIEYEYELIKKYYDYAYPLKKQANLKYIYLRTLEPEKAIEILENSEHDPNLIKSDEYYYTKCYLLIKNERYKDVLNLIENLKNIRHKYVSLYGLSLVLYFKKYNLKITEEEKQRYKKTFLRLTSVSMLKNEDSLHLAFIKLMQIELDNCNDTIIYNYIKNEMLYLFKNFHFTFYYEYCILRFYELMGKLCKYKDAYELLENIYFNKK